MSPRPLITAARYGDAEGATVLIEAGTLLEARSSADAGGVPDATALRHAAVFGNTAVLDVLLAAGARVKGLSVGPCAGDVSECLRPNMLLTGLVPALVMAADHQRLAIIDAVSLRRRRSMRRTKSGGRQALRLPGEQRARRQRRHLLAHGADPDHRYPAQHRTALGWCRYSKHRYGDGSGHAAVQALLAPAPGVRER